MEQELPICVGNRVDWLFSTMETGSIYSYDTLQMGYETWWITYSTPYRNVWYLVIYDT